MTGTGIAQVIAFLVSPIITRLFSRDDFTSAEQFTMLFNIMVVFATGRYEFAIMQPKENDRARHLLGLSLKIALYTSLVTALLVIFLNGYIADLFNNPSLKYWLWLLPIALLSFAFFNVFNYWFSRHKKYRVASASKVYFSLASEPLKIITGIMKLGTGGLLVSITAGNVISGWYVTRAYLREYPDGLKNFSKQKMKEVAREYIDYPKYTMWSALFNRIAQWVHIGLFSYFFGLQIVADMALSRRIFLNPLNIIAGSFSQVFYQRISEITDMKHLNGFYWKNFRRFLAFSVVFIGFIWLIPPSLIGFIFGNEWAQTVDIMRVLAFWYAFNFVSSSLSFISYRLNLQRFSFFMDGFHLIFMVAVIGGAKWLGFTEFEAVVIMTIAKVLIILIYFAYIQYYLKMAMREEENELN